MVLLIGLLSCIALELVWFGLDGYIPLLCCLYIYKPRPILSFLLIDHTVIIYPT